MNRLISIGLGLLLTCLLQWPSPVAAATWYETAVSSDRTEHQWVDLDSLLPKGNDRFEVTSLYENHRSDPPQRSLYRTEYRCHTQEFRDLSRNGNSYQQAWMTAAGDPLNYATLKTVCAMGAALR